MQALEWALLSRENNYVQSAISIGKISDSIYFPHLEYISLA